VLVVNGCNILPHWGGILFSLISHFRNGKLDDRRQARVIGKARRRSKESGDLVIAVIW
jgi:hypothetical protein